MKIAYVSRLNVSHERGVLKKVAGQLRAWIDAGEDAKLFALSSTSKVWEGMADLPVDVVVSGTKLTPLIRAYTLVKRVLAWQPDIAYVRWGQNYPSLVTLMKRVPSVIEINIDDIAESKALLPWHKYLYHRLTRNCILRKASGFACVTYELAERLREYTRPTVVIANGIELQKHVQTPAPNNICPRLVLIANVQKLDWHGVDKALWLAQRFPDWRFDLIGMKRDEWEFTGYRIPSNVTMHGAVGRSNYEDTLFAADAAIGTLALHRKEMDEACPLKVREYLANGIPTIIGYRDTDFLQPVPFLLEIPNTPTNVQDHVTDIEQFVAAWKGKRVPRSHVLHLDNSRKERERIAFFETLLATVVRERKDIT
jgi:hypothetical protein